MEIDKKKKKDSNYYDYFPETCGSARILSLTLNF